MNAKRPIYGQRGMFTERFRKKNWLAFSSALLTLTLTLTLTPTFTPTPTLSLTILQAVRQRPGLSNFVVVRTRPLEP